MRILQFSTLIVNADWFISSDFVVKIMTGNSIKKTLKLPWKISEGFKERMTGVPIITIPQCQSCVHWHEDLTCAAYPEGVPLGMLLNTIDHRFPFEGDSGIRFEKIKTSTDRFVERVVDKWLPEYCELSDRNYGPDNFKVDSISVTEVDAKNCMAAIDKGVVIHKGRGAYRAMRSTANEYFFTEGRKNIVPRRVSLWLETVIIFAGIGRLNSSYDWPISLLATQPKGWAFDIAAYKAESNDAPDILCEVKKTAAEIKTLQRDLLSLSLGAPLESVKQNSARKWSALVDQKPRALWLLGPGEHEYIYLPEYTSDGAILHAADDKALLYEAT